MFGLDVSGNPVRFIKPVDVIYVPGYMSYQTRKVRENTNNWLGKRNKNVSFSEYQRNATDSILNSLLVVTGGTKGIGRAIIYAFARRGFDIVTCARNLADLQSLQHDLQTLFPVQLHIFQADLAHAPEVHAFAEFVQTLRRPADVLIHNAGYFLPGQVYNEPEGTLESMLQIHVHSAYYLTKKLLPEMMAHRSGHIFTICSTASIMAYPNGGSYCIAKHALLGLTRELREELKTYGIRVTAVLPGATLTASWEGAGLPAERLMKPEDVAEAIYGAYALSNQTVIEELLLRPQLGDL